MSEFEKWRETQKQQSSGLPTTVNCRDCQKATWIAALKCMLLTQTSIGYSVPVVLVDTIEKELKELENE